ncbi:low temperature requirement protein A [Mitsuaria sp. GD03876]|uniref:low temperature requirement protein A n=1 Tax=Mitsuaria sp. GD03876 TaxID=2975399 RepID=UPI00244D24CE|nr:low temperature requirement protein A [Mitsuaria sp. GD03876]MDH0864147.1 low temperature requirement protein A [Mitsuaria sp. GD03876]
MTPIPPSPAASAPGRIPLLRPPDPHGHAKVTFVELFFDLVFVFAVTQLSHTLIGHFSLAGVLQTGFLMLAVWWVWIFTSWVTNWLDPERVPVRLCLFAIMLAGLLMSAALPQAFGERALMFAGSFAAIQLGRTLFFLWAVRGADVTMVRNFQRIGTWLTISAALWIAGAMDPTLRVPLWVAALAIEVVGPSMGFAVPGLGRSTTSDWNVSGGHLAERCALFVIIALGESLLVTGATFASEPLTATGLLAFLVSFAGSLAMWWLYFDTTNDFAAGRIAHSDDPGRLARLAYTYLHLPIVAAIIVNAAADEFVLAHPGGHTDLRTAVCLLGGVGLYATGVGLFKRAVVGRWPWSHAVAVIVLAAAGPFVGAWPPVATSAYACAVLMALAAWERHSRARCLVPDSAGQDEAPSIGP